MALQRGLLYNKANILKVRRETERCTLLRTLKSVRITARASNLTGKMNASQKSGIQQSVPSYFLHMVTRVHHIVGLRPRLIHSCYVSEYDLIFFFSLLLLFSITKLYLWVTADNVELGYGIHLPEIFEGLLSSELTT